MGIITQDFMFTPGDLVIPRAKKPPRLAADLELLSFPEVMALAEDDPAGLLHSPMTRANMRVAIAGLLGDAIHPDSRSEGRRCSFG